MTAMPPAPAPESLRPAERLKLPDLPSAEKHEGVALSYEPEFAPLPAAESTAEIEPAAIDPSPIPEPSVPLPDAEVEDEEASDAQLVAALLPIVESSLEKALPTPQSDFQIDLEPMLRATVRRTIAEQMQSAQHFGQIRWTDRIAWRLKALLTSRTYDDVVFEQTHRYQVEEVFLLRHENDSLISYASHDPSRHATPRKIRYDLDRLVKEIKDDEGEIKKSLDLPNKRTAIVRSAEDCYLIACVRGQANTLVHADLDYVLEQIEQRFGTRLRNKGKQFIHVLQPVLEGCLLIQSPAPPK